MMWQPNAAQPVAYAPAYNQGYAPVQTDGEFSSDAWIVAFRHRRRGGIRRARGACSRW